MAEEKRRETVKSDSEGRRTWVRPRLEVLSVTETSNADTGGGPDGFKVAGS